MREKIEEGVVEERGREKVRREEKWGEEKSFKHGAPKAGQ